MFDSDPLQMPAPECLTLVVEDELVADVVRPVVWRGTAPKVRFVCAPSVRVQPRRSTLQAGVPP